MTASGFEMERVKLVSGSSENMRSMITSQKYFSHNSNPSSEIGLSVKF
jgi:hypothetical protein